MAAVGFLCYFSGLSLFHGAAKGADWTVVCMRTVSVLLAAVLGASVAIPAAHVAAASVQTADYIITFTPGSDTNARASEMIRLTRSPAKRMFRHAISGVVMNLTPRAAAAALLSRYQTYTPAQVACHLTTRATSNVVLSAVPGKRAARVSWTAGSNGGSPLTSVRVWIYRAGVKFGSVTVPPTTSSVNVTGLSAGVGYRFAVSTINVFGSSPESALSNAVTPSR